MRRNERENGRRRDAEANEMKQMIISGSSRVCITGCSVSLSAKARVSISKCIFIELTYVYSKYIDIVSTRLRGGSDEQRHTVLS